MRTPADPPDSPGARDRDDEQARPAPRGAPGQLYPEVFVARRRARLERLLQQSLVPPRGSGASQERREYLLEEAQDLYWNELEWEKLTAEEMSKGGSALVEFAFPGFLALVDGLLLKEANADSPVPASPRPEVVEDVLLFLATRYLELLSETEPQQRLEREMTHRLVDLVLYRLHGISVDGVDRFDPARQQDDD
ncbi:MAG: hypothetical protein ACRELX_14325 [Longimicrobiales bacterium]